MEKAGVILRGINFGPIWGASGVSNFHGQGWDYHKYYKLISPNGFSFEGMTEVGKTTTLLPRDGITPGQGNMPLKKNLQPVERKPKCIKVFPILGAAANEVGLTGPGAPALFEMGLWQKKTKPHVISFMSLAATPELRLAEFREFKVEFKKHLPSFRAPVALTVNISCPNTKHAPKELENEWRGIGEEGQELGIPIGIKFGPEVQVQTIVDVSQSGLYDYVVLCNTLKVGNEVEGFSWRWAFGLRSFIWSLFGKVYSPLKKYGGGGYSGPKLRPIVFRLIRAVRAEGATIMIVACCGISKPEHVKEAAEAGANAVKVGTAIMLRFWRARSLTDMAYKVF